MWRDNSQSQLFFCVIYFSFFSFYILFSFSLNVLCYGIPMNAGHTLLIIFTCTGKGEGLPIGGGGGGGG